MIYFTTKWNSGAFTQLRWAAKLCFVTPENLNGKKIIPANLGELLTSRSLAYWAMDDGSKTGTGFRLNTQSFTKEENFFFFIRRTLKDNFNLDCSLHIHSKNVYRIFSAAELRSLLRNIYQLKTCLFFKV